LASPPLASRTTAAVSCHWPLAYRPRLFPVAPFHLDFVLALFNFAFAGAAAVYAFSATEKCSTRFSLLIYVLARFSYSLAAVFPYSTPFFRFILTGCTLQLSAI